jgi:hypothetical protein
LSAVERLVAITIAQHTDDALHGGSKYKLSAATIATEIGVSLRAVKSARRKLIETGWLAHRYGHYTIVGRNVEASIAAYRERRDEGRESRSVIRADRHAMRAELSHPVHQPYLAVSNGNVTPLAPASRAQIVERHGFVDAQDLQTFIDILGKVLTNVKPRKSKDSSSW